MGLKNQCLVCPMQRAMGITGKPTFTCSYLAFMWEKLIKGMLAEKYTTNWVCITYLVQTKDIPDHALCDLERKD